MPLLRTVILPGLGAIAVLAAVGRAIRILGGDDPREDRVVRALQHRFGHTPGDGEAVVGTDPGDPAAPRELIDRVTWPLPRRTATPRRPPGHRYPFERGDRRNIAAMIEPDPNRTKPTQLDQPVEYEWVSIWR